MYIRNVEIIDITVESKEIKTFFFDQSLDFIPGQYVMVWIRNVDEVPMSLSYADGITVRRVGEATSALFELGVGDVLGIRGPFGNGFKERHNAVLIVAGGLGAAPLAPFAELLDGPTITLLGAKTKQDLLFADRFQSAGDLLISTDDGSCGHHGVVIDLLERVQGYDEIVSCGPEPMMKAVFDFSIMREIQAQFSLQRYIKCGIGICGSCCVDPFGLRVCSDGPVFTSEQLLDSEFGRYQRDASGRKVNL